MFISENKCGIFVSECGKCGIVDNSNFEHLIFQSYIRTLMYRSQQHQYFNRINLKI